jgi:UTP-glucose-1-phosphate uridylyltransferase
MEKAIQTAIIPVAGTGARMLPAASTIEKCMMPLYLEAGAVPIVEFMIEDCARAGLERVIFVTTEHGQQELNRYLSSDVNDTLRELFETTSNYDKLNQERNRRGRFNLQYDYVTQQTNAYGTAVPLHAAQKALGDEEYFALLGGDDFVYHQDGTSELALAINAWNTGTANHLIMGASVARDVAADTYGVIMRDESGNFIGIDEKPPLKRVPKNPLVNISRYLLGAEIWEYVEAEMATERGKAEHKVTYLLNAAQNDGQTFGVHAVEGVYFDCGEPSKMFEAMQYIRQNPPIVY